MTKMNRKLVIDKKLRDQNEGNKTNRILVREPIYIYRNPMKLMLKQNFSTSVKKMAIETEETEKLSNIESGLPNSIWKKSFCR